MESTAVSARAALAGAARIVVKIGSNLVATREGAVNTLLLEGIAAELAALVREAGVSPPTAQGQTTSTAQVLLRRERRLLRMLRHSLPYLLR